MAPWGQSPWQIPVQEGLSLYVTSLSKHTFWFSRPNSVSNILSNHPTNHRNVPAIPAFLTSELHMTQLSENLKVWLENVAAGVYTSRICVLPLSPGSITCFLQTYSRVRQITCSLSCLWRGYKTPSLDRQSGGSLVSLAGEIYNWASSRRPWEGEELIVGSKRHKSGVSSSYSHEQNSKGTQVLIFLWPEIRHIPSCSRDWGHCCPQKDVPEDTGSYTHHTHHMARLS